jgi:hypothetical protein
MQLKARTCLSRQAVAYSGRLHQVILGNTFTQFASIFAMIRPSMFPLGEKAYGERHCDRLQNSEASDPDLSGRAAKSEHPGLAIIGIPDVEIFIASDEEGEDRCFSTFKAKG